ncbi:MAG: glycosyltransferase [Proteobacteria bacterium]|nr:glycosyltransferase [Pseudomonadota bacterium]
MKNKTVRVLHILNELNPSGAETMLYSAASRWSQHGIDCDILSTGAQIGPYAENLQSVGYGIFHIHNTKRPKFFIELKKLIESGCYDVIHQHAEGVSFWTMLLAKLMGKKVIRTVHNNFNFSGNLCIRRKIQRKILSILGVMYVSISESVQKNELLRFGLRTKKINNWASIDYFLPPNTVQRSNARETFGFKDSDLVMVSVGNCNEVKNHESIIEAIAKLVNYSSLKYLHIGDGSACAHEQQLVASLNIGEQVVFAGQQNPLPALYAADFFIMPSRYEGFGIAALEAYSTNLPCILADVAGLRDFKSLFKNTVYCNAEGNDLDVCILNMIENIDLYRAHALAYHDVAKTNFSIEDGVASYSMAYIDLLI